MFCVDCDGKADGPWASAGAEFPGTATDTEDQKWRGWPGQHLALQCSQHDVLYGVCRMNYWRMSTMCGLCAGIRLNTTRSQPGRCWSLALQLQAKCWSRDISN